MPEYQEDAEDKKYKELMRELSALLNRYSYENRSDTPDFMLAEYMLGCLTVYENTIANRTRWLSKGDDGRIYLKREFLEAELKHEKNDAERFPDDVAIDLPNGRDPLFDKAEWLAKGRTTLNARRLAKDLNITYARASALIDQLEEAGIITAAKRGKPRKVV